MLLRFCEDSRDTFNIYPPLVPSGKLQAVILFMPKRGSAVPVIDMSVMEADLCFSLIYWMRNRPLEWRGSFGHFIACETTMLKELRLVIGDDYAKLEPVEQGKGVAKCETTSFLIAE